MGEVYAWSNATEPQRIERFVGVPLDGMRGTSKDCVVLVTSAGETLFHGDNVGTIQRLCSQVEGTVQAAAVGASHFVACTDAGIVFSQGENDVGQTGQGHTDDVDTPFPLKIKSQVREVQAGAKHCLALTNTGTVYGWGTGFYGQHGGVKQRPQMTPRLLSFQKCKISSISVGDDFSLALATDGRIWAWGANSCGQLGLGDTVARFKPQVVGSTQTSVGSAEELKGNPCLVSKANDAVRSTWVSIGAGRAHSIACDASGALYTWGFNMQGQLGHGATRESSRRPALVNLVRDQSHQRAQGEWEGQSAKKGQAEAEAGDATAAAAAAATVGAQQGAEREVVEDQDQDTLITQVGAAGYYSAALSRNGKVYTFGKMAVAGSEYPEVDKIDAGTPCLIRKFSNAKLRITQMACSDNRICVYARPIFKSMSFNCSPFHGGTELKLEGTSFFSSDLIRVRFSPKPTKNPGRGVEGAPNEITLEPIVVGGVFDSTTGDIICTTPPLEDTHAHYIPNEDDFHRIIEEAAELKAEQERERRREEKKRKKKAVAAGAVKQAQALEEAAAKAAAPEDEDDDLVFYPNLDTVVDISLDGGLTWSDEKHEFMFYNNPTFTEVLPPVVGNGGRGTVINLAGDGLFRLPAATGPQRNVVGVRINIFKAKKGDHVVAPKKKVVAKKTGPTVWDPIEHTVLCEGHLEEEVDEETGEVHYSVACNVPPLEFLTFTEGPIRRGMVEVSMNNSDYPDKEDYEVGLPVEFRVFANSIEPLPASSSSSVCIRRADQDADRTTNTVTVTFRTPLPKLVETHPESVGAKLTVVRTNNTDLSEKQVIELGPEMCHFEGRAAVVVTIPQMLTIPDGCADALLSVSVNGGEEYSNEIPLQLYAGLCGVVTRGLNDVQGLPPHGVSEPAAYAQWPAMVSEEGGVDICIFPQSRASSWLRKGARPTVEFIDPADGGVLATVTGANVDLGLGCVVVSAATMAPGTVAFTDPGGVKRVQVRVAMNGADFLDSSDESTEETGKHSVHYYPRVVAKEALLVMGPDPVEVARIEKAAEEKAAAAAAAAAQEAADIAEGKAKPKSAKGKAKAKGKGKGKKGAPEVEEEEKAPIVPVSVNIEGTNFVERQPVENGGGVVVRFVRQSDKAVKDVTGVIAPDGSVECPPPVYAYAAPEKKDSPTSRPTSAGSKGSAGPAETGMTVAVSVNGGQQFSKPVVMYVQEYTEF